MSRGANPLRGESEITIAGNRLVLRPSFDALVAAENEIGSLFALVERAASGALALSEISALVWHCLPSDDRPSREEVGEAVLEIGLVAATQPVRAILSEALKGRA